MVTNQQHDRQKVILQKLVDKFAAESIFQGQDKPFTEYMADHGIIISDLCVHDDETLTLIYEGQKYELFW